MTEDPPRRAGVYLRISEDRNGDEAGVSRQREDDMALVARRGWTLAGEFCDNDTSAAGKAERPGFRALLAAIERGTVTAVVAWTLDRLVRTARDRLALVEACQQHGVIIALVRGSDMDPTTPAGRLAIGILGEVAQHEIAVKGDRQRRAEMQAAQAGRPRGGGPRRFGYERDGVTVRPVEADAIRRGVEAVLAGATLSSVARDWNAAGLVRPSTGGRWVRAGVRDTLRRPRNAALRVYQGEVIGPATWPAIVEIEQWKAVEALFADEGRRTTAPGINPHQVRHLLSGLAVCGGCGRADLRVSTSGNRGRDKRPSYRCAQSAGRVESGHVARSVAALDAYVTAVVLERLRRPDVVELLTPAAPGIDLDALRARVNTARHRLTEIAQDYGDGVISRAEMITARERATTRLSAAEAELDAATAPTPLAGIADQPDPGAAWLAADLGRQRAVLAALMTVVVLPVPRGGGRGRPVEGFDLDPTYIRIIPEEAR
jgi:site-specific DNA recombinase